MNTSTPHACSPIDVFCSNQFLPWLDRESLSLAFTTYQSSKLLLIGVNPDGTLAGYERPFKQAMGLYATPERLIVSTSYQIWQLDNMLAPEQLYSGYDKLYVPRISYTTGNLDIHDLVVDRHGRVIFVSTLLNCLATVGDRNSCIPVWQPPFITKLVNEDRCHLNGLAMVEGIPRYVTTVSRSDVVDGWRDRRKDGGCVIDVLSNSIVCTGLSMPHSPRWYQGKLWLLNAGTGELGYVDLASGKFEPISFCPGYVRGLAFWKNFAIVGLSKPRHKDYNFSGLELDERLAAKDTEARCGLMVIDINTGGHVHWLRMEGEVRELYDVQVLPGVRRPMALGLDTDEISRMLTISPLVGLKGLYGDAVGSAREAIAVTGSK